jgi:hypothetical protein
VRAATLSPLGRAAALAVAAHLAAALLSLGELPPGSPGAPLPDRLAHVAAAGWGWRLAWLAWMAAGVSLVALLARARRGLPGEPLATLAVVAAALGLAVDAPCDLAQGWLQPLLAADPDPGRFLVAERWLTLAGYTVANGLYSLAALALTVAVARHGARALLATGLPLVAAGLWLAVAGAVGAFAQTTAAAATTVALCLLWPPHLAWLLDGRPGPRAG